MRNRREGEKGNTSRKGKQYIGKVMVFYGWVVKATFEVYNSRTLVIRTNK